MKIKTFVILVLVGLCLFVGVKFVSAYIDISSFEMDLDKKAVDMKAESDNKVVGDICEVAARRDIVIENHCARGRIAEIQVAPGKENIEIRREQRTIRIKGYRVVDLHAWQYVWHFEYVARVEFR